MSGRDPIMQLEQCRRELKEVERKIIKGGTGMELSKIQYCKDRHAKLSAEIKKLEKKVNNYGTN